MPGLTALNALPPADFEQLLLGCCAAPGWARRVAAGRPYESVADLLAAADAAWAARDPGDLDAAMDGHPRIGERRLSGWSAREQSAVGGDTQALAALAAANAEYEQHFGHVFLICATGRGPGEILAELRRRMANDPAAEREVAAAEIGKINALRLRRLAGLATVSTHILDTTAGRPAAGVPVALESWSGGAWQRAGSAVTGPGGRVTGLPPVYPPEPGQLGQPGQPSPAGQAREGEPASAGAAGASAGAGAASAGGSASAGEAARLGEAVGQGESAGPGESAGAGEGATARLVFAVREYLLASHGAAFFPEVTVAFAAAPGEHYHIPLLLSPHAYSTYRGS